MITVRNARGTLTLPRTGEHFFKIMEEQRHQSASSKGSDGSDYHKPTEVVFDIDVQPLPFSKLDRQALMRPAKNSMRRSVRIQSIPFQEPVPGVPEGLEVFEGMHTIYLKREVSTWPQSLEALGMDSRFSVLNENEFRIMFAGEVLTKQCTCLPSYARPFVVQIFNTDGIPVLEVQRPWSPRLSLFGGEQYGNDIYVSLSEGNVYLGKVIQKLHICEFNDFRTAFDIFDSKNIRRLRVEWGQRRPCYHCCRCKRRKKVNEVGLNLIQFTGKRTQEIAQDFLVLDTMDPGENILLASHSLNLHMRIPPEMDCTLIALLLGFMFSVFITYYEQRLECVVSDPMEPIRQRRLGYCGCTGIQIFKVIAGAILIAGLVVAAATLTHYQHRGEDAGGVS